MMEDYDTIINELTVVRRKLESKEAALNILNGEVRKCRADRDRYKELAQHPLNIHLSKFTADERSCNETIANLTENNRRLQKELDEVKNKCSELQGDVKLLREIISKQRQNSEEGEANGKNYSAAIQDRQILIDKLETSKTKYSMLERDLQAVLDEKEELVNERDAYKSKVERLNNQLNYVLKGDERRIVDVDTLVMENRYLQERLKEIQEEKSLYIQTLSKYKV